MAGNILILLAAALSLIYAGLVLYAICFADSLIFPAPRASYSDGPAIFKLQTAGGESISAYFLEAPGSKHVLLYSHGNGEDIGDIRPLLTEFQQRGVSVLAYDYPGYGTSSGEPGEQGVYEAAEAAFLYLTEEKSYPTESITLYGHSLGSGPSCWLAARYPVSGLILDGAFSSTFRVMTNIKLLPFDKFDNLAILPDLECPVLMIHGMRDNVVPFTHAIKNEKALRGAAETLWVETAGHGNLIELAGDDYWSTTLAFIKN